MKHSTGPSSPEAFALSEGVTHTPDEEDLFTQAPIEHSIENTNRILGPDAVEVDGLRSAWWMTGSRVKVDIHGDTVNAEVPG